MCAAEFFSGGTVLRRAACPWGHRFPVCSRPQRGEQGGLSREVLSGQAFLVISPDKQVLISFQERASMFRKVDISSQNARRGRSILGQVPSTSTLSFVVDSKEKVKVGLRFLSENRFCPQLGEDRCL